ncbi:MAG: Lrp/AsnC family transcriptional regulator [Rhodobacteraceae bacterium]|jgi:DNA-binding Lrp family transcriptional regulator|nr:Lrp/AsnC family transcriptional regulator [Paracoccaceae bacterium]
MDDLDRTLLAQLAADARVPLATLARRLKVARSTIQARLERLEASGIIVGYTVRLGEAARTDRIRATVLLGVEPRAHAAVLARLKALAEVARVVTTSGRVDLLVEIAAPSTAALDSVLDAVGAIPGVRASESLIHLATKIDRSG